jgi:hypothetical protein
VAEEAKKAGISKSEVRSKIACRKARERSKTLAAIAEYRVRKATARDAKARGRRKARAANAEARARKAKACAVKAEGKACAAKLTAVAHEKRVHDIAAQVALTLAKTGMHNECCKSLTTGPQACQDWVELVTEHVQEGEPPETFAKVDIEGTDNCDLMMILATLCCNGV